MGQAGDDIAIRKEAFQWLESQVRIYGDVLPRSVLEQGFHFEGRQIRMVGPQGIFKPRHMELPISITTVPSGPYDDEFGYDGLLLYRYRGTDPSHRDNVGLRRAMKIGTPLVYFHRVLPGKYLAAWPVFIVADNPSQLTFSVAVDENETRELSIFSVVQEGYKQQPEDIFRRSYATREFRQRLHQSSFRERVLRAYRDQCALCRLRHRELLDAAHILPDAEPGGEPLVSNGLSLCKLHHAAFDRYFVGVREDYIVEVRPDILDETDGPMLIHGLQNLHGAKIILPRVTELRPNPEFLHIRYERFRAAG
ncbi:HNH endonuclease [Thermodesulfobacteriota bacterium]